jgi:predicted RNA polymerase sigma factor
VNPPAALERALVDAGPQVLAHLTRLLGDLAAAEDLLQEARARALEAWGDSPPANPGGWLMLTARRLALDLLRDRGRRARLAPDAWPEHAGPALPEPVPDDLLRLVFTACHPVLSPEARVALALKALCGLGVPEIARAHLEREATVAQRIVRARRLIAERRIRYEVPGAAELPARLPAVLETIYLVFNEGYTASEGDALVRAEMARTALHLGRRCAELLPGEPEVLGLVALLELQASRSEARTDAAGRLVAIEEQDRSLWDAVAIARGAALLDRALALHRPGPYQVQAAIAALHARARSPEETPWDEILGLYDVLLRMAPSPVTALARTVAVRRVRGPLAALAEVDGLASLASLRDYHRLPAVRARLLEDLGRAAEAVEEYRRAASMARNGAERAWLEARAQALEATRG